MMNYQSPQTRIEAILDIITPALVEYHDNGNSPLTDEEYDRLYDELRTLAPNHPFFKTVGVPPCQSSKLVKRKHEMPMGSLDKITPDESDKQFKTWCQSIKCLNGDFFFCTQKFDGSSVEIVYENGSLLHAITRGDGVEGEDVTHNIIKAKGVPLKAATKERFSVRVEVYLPISVWKKMKDPGKNPRNTAAGIVRRTDGQGAELLHVVAIDTSHPLKYERTWAAKYEQITLLGFYVPRNATLAQNEVAAWVENEEKNRDVMDHEFDGIVIAVSDLRRNEYLGAHDQIPYWARAWKFKAMNKASKIRSVVWTMGVTGNIHPTAQIDPVDVGGVTVSNVSLHNMNEIERMHLMIGSKVEVCRAGDVIPYIVRSLDVLDPHDGKKIVCTKCPGCGGSVHREKGEPFYTCKNTETCTGVNFQRTAKWISKRGIMFLGESTLEKLAPKDIPELYRLTYKHFEYAGIGSGMAEKIMKEIENSRTVTVTDFIGSLSIDGLGRSEAKNIVAAIEAKGKKLQTVEHWLNLTATDLLACKGFKDTKAEKIIQSIKNRKKLILELADEMQFPKAAPVSVAATGNGKLAGMSFCFTGAMPSGRDRKEMQAIVEANGGKVASSVSKNLKFLVMADANSKSGKAEDARKLGVIVLSETQFDNLLK